jgi:hypothetical protein
MKKNPATVRPIKRPTKTLGWEIRARFFGRFEGAGGVVGHRSEDVWRRSVPKFVRGIDGFVFVESVDRSVE